jgi:hypothetical protein
MINRPNELAPESNVIPEEFIDEKIIASSEGDVGDDESAVVDDVGKIDPKTGLPIPGSKKRKVAGTSHHKIAYEKVTLHTKANAASNLSGGGGHSQEEHGHHHIFDHHNHTFPQIDPLAMSAAQALIAPPYYISEEKNSVLSETLARINILVGQNQDIAQESNNTNVTTSDNKEPAEQVVEREL